MYRGQTLPMMMAHILRVVASVHKQRNSNDFMEDALSSFMYVAFASILCILESQKACSCHRQYRQRQPARSLTFSLSFHIMFLNGQIAFASVSKQSNRGDVFMVFLNVF